MKPLLKSTDDYKDRLTPEQYRVTRKKGTERAFTGKYWDHHATGTYRCVVCGTPLFDSSTKFGLRYCIKSAALDFEDKTAC